MKRAVDQAIVLRRVNYGESDRVITLLAKEHGKISVFAKGCRKQNSRLSGGIELLSVNEISIVEGKSDLKTLVGARLIKHFDNIVKDMNKMQSAFDALEKVNRLVEDNYGQEYFDILDTCLTCLNDETYDSRIVEVWCTLNLLQVSGALGEIKVAEDETDIEEYGYKFDFDKHGFYSDPAGDFSRDDIKLLRLLERSQKPVKLVSETGSESELKQFARVLLAVNLA